MTAGGKGTAVATYASSVGKGEPAGPEITSVTPDSGAVGTSVTVTGTGFGAAQGNSTVSFNGTAGVPTSWSETAIQVPVPAGATTGPVTVTVGGQKSNGVEFRLTPPLKLGVPTSLYEGWPVQTVTVKVPPSAKPATDTLVTFTFGGTAERGTDYTMAETVTLPANQSSVTTTLEVTDDTAYEFRETITLQATAEGFQASPLKESNLIDNDSTKLTVTSDPTSVGEAASDRTARVTVSVPEGSEPATDAPITFSRSGTAKPGTDYTIAFAVTLPAGDASVTTTLEVTDDAAYEGDETIVLHATGNRGTGLDRSAPVTIQLEDDDPAPLTLTVDPSSVSEPSGTATVTVTVPAGEAPAAEATITLEHTGRASNGTDYAVGALKIAAGDLSGTATLRVRDNTVFEGTKTISLQATHSDYQASAVVEISLTDDEVPSLSLTVSPDSVGEADGQRLATVTVSLPAGEELGADVTVALLHTGTATVAAGDYTVGALTIEADQNRPTPSAPFRATATLEVVDDGDYEGAETIVLQASAPGYAASALLEIALEDDDPAPLTLTVDPSSVSEPSGTATVTVTAGEAPAAEATITLEHTGSATSGTDYTVGALTIAAGDLSGTATLRVRDNTVFEGTKTISLQATHSDYQASAVVEISLTDDEVPSLSLTVSPDSVGEADGQRLATVTVSLPAGEELGADVTVALLHTGTATVAAGDYTVGALTIEADQNRPTPSAPFRATATLEVVDDGDYEGAETIVLQASAPGYAASALLEIALEDDDPAPLTLTVDPSSVSEPSGTATVTVTVPAGAAPAAEATITLEHTGSATSGTDYTVGTLTIAAGDLSGTATLRVRNNTVFEGTKTIALQATHSNYQASKVLEIALIDDEKPPLTLTADAASVSEPDGTATLTVSVPEGGAPDVDTTISIWDLGYARGGEDYRVGTLTIEDGDLSGTATLEVIDDTVYEGTEVIWIQAAKEGFKISPTLKIPLEDNEQNQAPVVSSPLPALTTNVDVASTVSLSSHFSDPEGHDLVYEATSSKPSVVTVSVDGSTLTVTGVGVGISTITVTATDQPQDSDDSLPTGTTFTATVENRAPECEDIDDQAVNVNVWQSLTASCTDPDGHELTYSHVSSDTSKVDTTTSSPKQSGFSVIGVAVGTATVTVTVTDGHQGSDTVEFDVTVPNRAPECSDIPVQTLLVADSQTVDLSQYCSDPDGHPLTYAVASSATDKVTASVDGSTLTLTGVAVTAETLPTITVTATDDPDEPQEPLSDTETFTATIENHDPECDDIAGQTVKVGQSKTLTVSCTDPDGHTLSYAVTSSDTSKVTVSKDGASVTVTAAAVGSATMTVTASDGHGGSDTETFDVTVPTPDCTISSIDGQTVKVTKSKTVSLSATCDPPADTLTYTATSSDTAKATASVSGSTLTVTGVAEGTATVTVTVTDGRGGSDTETLDVTVEPLNEPPVCKNIPVPTLWVNDSTTVDLSQYCSDPDGDNLTYSATSSKPSKVTKSVTNYPNSNRGTLTLTGKAIGSSTITVKASDGSLSTTKTLTARVDNRDPECEDIASQTVYVNASKTLTVSCTDPDGHSLSYSASSSDTSKVTVSMDGSSVTITGVAAGTATVSVTAADGYGGSDTKTFTVTVKKRPPSPKIPRFIADDTTLYPDESTYLRWTTTNADNTEIDQDVGDVTPAESGFKQVRPGSVGIHTYTLTATGDPNARLDTASKKVKVTVIDRPDSPEITRFTADDTTLYPDESTYLRWTTTNADNTEIDQDVGDVTPAESGFKQVRPGSVGIHTYTLTATGDPNARPDTASKKVKVTVIKRPCSLTSISNQTVNVGASKTLSLPDTDECTYSATSSDTSKVTVSVNNATDTLTVTGVAVGTATVSVSVTDVTGTNTFTVTVVMPSPVISRISPNLGQTDTRATIYGANFGTDEGSVSFGGSSADINSWNDTWISVLVPLHLSVGTVSVSVTTAHSAGSKTSNSVTFRVTGGPVQRDEEEECEDKKDCPEDEGEGEEKGEEEGEEESGDSGETEEDPSGG